MTTIDVLCGGPGRERAVSLVSGAAIHRALAAAGADVRLLTVADQLEIGQLRAQSVVFNVIHGTYGEDGTLQSELQAAGWRFVGSTAAASRLCMDKVRTREVVAAAGVTVSWGQGLDPRNPQAIRDVVPPTLTGLVVKPARDGSSVGLRFIPSKSFLLPTVEELLAELGPIPLLVEERLPGPEFTVAILEDEQGIAQALPPIAIQPAAGVYDYQAKYERDDTRYGTVDDVSLAQTLCEQALRAYGACGCRHFARCDFMLNSQGQPAMLEINTLPGFTGHSLVPMAAARQGMDFTALCFHLVARAAASTSNE